MDIFPIRESLRNSRQKRAVS